MELQKYWAQAYGAIINFWPKLIGALAILALAVFVAFVLSRVSRYLINKTNLGKKLKVSEQDLGQTVGQAFFWLTILISLPAILGALGMQGLLAPMQSMSAKVLAFLPNLIGAGLIFGIGYAIATIARRAVTSILNAAQADKLAKKVGLDNLTGSAGIANFSGLLVFTLLIIPVAIAALDALGISSVSNPAKQMLQGFLDAIPNISAAAIVLLLAFVIGRFALDTLSNLLPAIGFDNITQQLGITDDVIGNTPPSRIAGYVAYIAIMVFGVIEAAKLLNFQIVSEMLSTILSLGGRVLLGSVIIAFGIIAADFVSRIVSKSKEAKPVAGLIRYAIIFLAAAMGLRQMGLANEIITLGFTMFMGALAVGAAIAIGWGGKDVAFRLLDKWTKDL